MVVDGLTDSTGFWVNILLCWLLLFNATTIFVFLVPSNFADDKVEYGTWMFIAVLMLAGHLLYFNSNRVRNIVNNEFSNEDKFMNRAGYLLALLYVGFSIWMFSYRTVPYIEEKNTSTQQRPKTHAGGWVV